MVLNSSMVLDFKQRVLDRSEQQTVFQSESKNATILNVRLGLYQNPIYAQQSEGMGFARFSREIIFSVHAPKIISLENRSGARSKPSLRAYSIAVERFHGMEQVGVRLPVGPPKETSLNSVRACSRVRDASRWII